MKMSLFGYYSIYHSHPQVDWRRDHLPRISSASGRDISKVGLWEDKSCFTRMVFVTSGSIRVAFSGTTLISRRISHQRMRTISMRRFVTYLMDVTTKREMFGEIPVFGTME